MELDSKYKTLFVEVQQLGRGLKFKSSVNGDQLARDVQATVEAMERKGFVLFSIEAISGYRSQGYSTTEGVLLVFKKEEGEDAL